MATAALSDIAAMKNSSTFRDRVTLAVAYYAQFILGNANSNTFAKVNWARNALQNPDGVAQGLYAGVSIDGTISDAAVLGAATDAQVRAATENLINQVTSF